MYCWNNDASDMLSIFRGFSFGAGYCCCCRRRRRRAYWMSQSSRSDRKVWMSGYSTIILMLEYAYCPTVGGLLKWAQSVHSKCKFFKLQENPCAINFNGFTKICRTHKGFHQLSCQIWELRLFWYVFKLPLEWYTYWKSISIAERINNWIIPNFYDCEWCNPILWFKFLDYYYANMEL